MAGRGANAHQSPLAFWSSSVRKDMSHMRVHTANIACGEWEAGRSKMPVGKARAEREVARERETSIHRADTQTVKKDRGQKHRDHDRQMGTCVHPNRAIK